MGQYDETDATDVTQVSARAHEAFAAARGEHSHDPGTSVREVEYKGRLIRIETTYTITVDGEPVAGHVMVDRSGRVHYHSIPNQEFDSAVGMVQRIIDLAPPDDGAAGGGGGQEGEDQEGGGHAHGGHGG